MGRKLTYLAMFAMVLAALGLWFRHFRRSSSGGYGEFVGPDSDTPEARAIRLVGIQPYGSDDLLDANGRKIGEMFSVGTGYDGSFRPAQTMRRCFVLELPRTDEPIVFHDESPVRAHGEARSLGAGVNRREGSQGTKRLVIYEVRIPSSTWESGIFSSHRVPVDRVDLTVRFYCGGPSDDYEASFAGPFAPGSTPVQRKANGCTLTIRPKEGSRGTEFSIQSNRRLDVKSPVLLYDARGRRHKANRRGYSSSSRSTTIQCSLVGLRWAEVTRVVVGERSQMKTFRNIRVRYSDRPTSGYPAYAEQMAKALGRSAKDVMRRGPRDATEALKVMHLARGQQVERVCEKLVTLKFGELPPAQQKAVGKVVRLWCLAPLPAIRLSGVKLALASGSEGGVAEAVALLRGQDRGIASQTSYALQRYARSLSEADIRLVASALSDEANPRVTPQLMACLTHSQTSAATMVLRQIACTDGSPWLWWRAIQSLEFRKTTAATQPASKMLQLRRILVRGVKESDDPLVAEAYRMLPALLTPECSEADGSVFQQIYARILRDTSRATATKAIVDFLRQARARRGVATGQADRMVKQLNLWYAVNLGRLGWDIAWSRSDFEKKRWIALIDMVLQWYERGGANEVPAPAAGGGTGPIVTKTVHNRQQSDPTWLDFETGTLLTCPTGVYRRGRKARLGWAREKGVDVRVRAFRRSVQLEGFDWRVSAIPQVWWPGAAAGQVQLALMLSAKRTSHRSTEAVPFLPATFCFETREGTRGLLRVVKHDPAAKGVTVEYRLLRSAASAPAGS